MIVNKRVLFSSLSAYAGASRGASRQGLAARGVRGTWCGAPPGRTSETTMPVVGWGGRD